MNCDKKLLVQAYFDGELDAAATLDIEAHITACAGCDEWLRTLQGIRTSIRENVMSRPAPARLASNIAAALDGAGREGRTGQSSLRVTRPKTAAARKYLPIGFACGAASAAMVAATLFLLVVPSASNRLIDDITTAHVRSLMADHLIDVASSDQHTVKPWFDGRVDVAPPVADFAAEGFPLVGGRAEYIDGKRIPAVVYRAGKHVINVFSWPEGGSQIDGLKDHDGFHILTWHSGDLAFCAVSDVAPDELKRFVGLLQSDVARPGKE